MIWLISVRNKISHFHALRACTTPRIRGFVSFTIGIAMKHPSRTWEWLRVGEKQSMLSICVNLHTINMGASIYINYKLIINEHQLTITKKNRRITRIWGLSETQSCARGYCSNQKWMGRSYPLWILMVDCWLLIVEPSKIQKKHHRFHLPFVPLHSDVSISCSSPA